LVQSVRLHLYTSDIPLELLERVTLVNKLDSFIESYRRLLDLVSTPLPFGLVQMGRVFLFIWTFSMPLVLLQGPFTDLWTAMIFLFCLTYGFVGLELVAMKLTSPFGDGVHDIQVTNLRDVRDARRAACACLFMYVSKDWISHTSRLSLVRFHFVHPLCSTEATVVGTEQDMASFQRIQKQPMSQPSK
jgi:hypothetical protein